jgi:arylsulfatase A-like enzyme
MLADEGALRAVQPGRVHLHLWLFFCAWAACAGGVMLLAPRWSRPAPLRHGVLATLAGLALLELDRRALVDLYPAVHLWLLVLGLACLLRGLTTLAGVLRGPLLRVFGLAALGLTLLLAAAFVLRGGGTADAAQRAALVRTAPGSSLLWLRGRLGPALRSRAPRVSQATSGPHDPIHGHRRYLDGAPLAEPLNVLLITVDALRADAVSRSDQPDPVAPHLQALARVSVDFERAYAQGSRTAISMSSLLLGRYPARLDWRLHTYVGGRITPLSQVPGEATGRDAAYTTLPVFPPAATLARRLSEAGLHTIGVPFAGKNQFFQRGSGFERGFRDYRDLSRAGWPTPASERVSELALQAIDAAAGRRWFAWVHYYDVHASRLTRDDYRRMLGFFDAGLGRLLDGLQSRGLRERTLVVLTSDHGEALGEHGNRGHATTLYEEQVRVPLLIHLPGVPPRRERRPVAVLDVSATLAVATGARTAGLDGVNLLPLMREGRYPPRRAIVTELHRYRGPGVRRTLDLDGLILGRHKLIVDRTREVEHFFDLQADPAEADDLILRPPPQYPQLRAVLERFVTRHGREHPLP